MSKKALVPTNVYSSSSQPTGQYAGDVYFDPASSILYTFNGTSWISPIVGSAVEIDGGAPNSSYAVSIDGGRP